MTAVAVINGLTATSDWFVFSLPCFCCFLFLSSIPIVSRTTDGSEWGGPRTAQARRLDLLDSVFRILQWFDSIPMHRQQLGLDPTSPYLGILSSIDNECPNNPAVIRERNVLLDRNAPPATRATACRNLMTLLLDAFRSEQRDEDAIWQNGEPDDVLNLMMQREAEFTVYHQPTEDQIPLSKAFEAYIRGILRRCTTVVRVYSTDGPHWLESDGTPIPCSICQESLVPCYVWRETSRLPCGHFFHKWCVEAWHLQPPGHLDCPVCRQDIRSAD